MRTAEKLILERKKSDIRKRLCVRACMYTHFNVSYGLTDRSSLKADKFLLQPTAHTHTHTVDGFNPTVNKATLPGCSGSAAQTCRWSPPGSGSGPRPAPAVYRLRSARVQQMLPPGASGPSEPLTETQVT